MQASSAFPDVSTLTRTQARQYLDAISQAAEERMARCDSYQVARAGSAAIAFMTPEEREFRHAVVMAMPMDHVRKSLPWRSHGLGV
jgi:hypothetical protein